MVVYFIAGIFRKQEENKNGPGKKISVIIPFRNESDVLPVLLDSLKKNSFQDVEFLFVDDHSEDKSADLILTSGLENARVINLVNDFGKKAAIRKAVAESKGEILVFTDADCRMGPNWVDEITAPIRSGKFVMVCGPIGIRETGFFARLQHLDILALSASSFSSGNLSRPFMCSAANMAVLKSEWRQANNHFESGDDMFLLHQLKAEGKGITFIWKQSAEVLTQPVPTLGGFISQRIRWAGKSKGYSDLLSIVISFLVLFGALSLIIGLCCTMFYPELCMPVLICLGSRASIDFLFLFLSERRLGNYPDYRMFIPGLVFHLLYVPLVALVSLFYRPVWKGRRIQ